MIWGDFIDLRIGWQSGGEGIKKASFAGGLRSYKTN
jgi:hypothetical protein